MLQAPGPVRLDPKVGTPGDTFRVLLDAVYVQEMAATVFLLGRRNPEHAVLYATRGMIRWLDVESVVDFKTRFGNTARIARIAPAESLLMPTCMTIVVA